VVDAGTSSRWKKQGERTSLRVHNFARLGSTADSAQALTAELKLLADSHAFSRRAWVTLWDVRSSHQYLLLPAGRQKELETIARQHGASVFGLDARGISVGIAQGPAPPPGGPQKIQVSFFAAVSTDIQDRLRPIQEAGFVVEGVTTPCGALWAQARLRRTAMPGEVHAYVALGAALSALVIVSNGFLLYARELHWGYAESPVGPPGPLLRDDLALRLSAELKRSFLYLKQYWEEDVSQVLLCGDMPAIRSLTAPLIERLNVEVETLDSLDGIDTSALPEPADRFADQIASLRLASAIAAEPPPVNLLPLQITVERASRKGQIVFAVGAAAAVAFGAFLFAEADGRTRSAERSVVELQRQIGALQPRVRAIEAARQGAGVELAQRAALEAFDSQGPRVARMLEALSEATPPAVTLKAIHAVADGSAWRVVIDGAATSPDPSRARLAVDSFLRGIEVSTLFGTPRGAPVRRMATGASGLELTAEYSVRK
jgi:Tfp pilus assembly protein PilN